MLGPGEFFGEGCLAGQRQRMATSTARTAVTVLVIPKAGPCGACCTSGTRCRTCSSSKILARNIRVEEDLVDQLFNSSEKRLARALLRLSFYGQPDACARGRAPHLAGDPGGDRRHHAVAGERVHEAFRALGFVDDTHGLRVNPSLLTVVLRD